MRKVMAAVLLVLPLAVQGQEPQCPQPRFTGTAPEPLYSMENPLAATRANLRAGRRLYRGKVEQGVDCAICHGRKGDGLGPLSGQFEPPPRNFTCEATVNGVPDGQLFWIIRNGSPGTAMPAHESLSDTAIWQLVLELRRLAD